MKRELKFRAYLKKEKEMREVFSFCDKFIKVIVGLGSAWKLDRSEFEPIMQFTGLKDKNGVDIYDGDIVITGISKYIGLVGFNEGSFVWENRTIKSCIKHTCMNECEIIGNIYENPELLSTK